MNGMRVWLGFEAAGRLSCSDNRAGICVRHGRRSIRRAHVAAETGLSSVSVDAQAPSVAVDPEGEALAVWQDAR